MSRTCQDTVDRQPLESSAPGSRAEPVSSLGDQVRRSRAQSLRHALSFSNASALYVFAALFILFSIWVPGTFLTWNTFKSTLDEQAVTALAAVGLTLPLAAGAFDLAVGSELGLGAILVAWLISKGVSVPEAIAIAVVAGAVTGLANGLLITRARIDSFIATLGVSSVLLGVITWASGGQQIVGLGASFQSIGTNQLFGLAYPVYYVLIAAVVVWFVLERTPAGRRIYATGGNQEAARLVGIRTSLVVVVTLIVSAAAAAAAGVVLSSQLATGDPTVGPPYLLPAFTAVFLGSTQFKAGRFNVLGTLVAVYVLAIGVNGFILAGAPVWIPDLFNGVALLIAVGMAKYQRGTDPRFAAIRGLTRRRVSAETRVQE
jgi:ribose transport system permease protein